VVALFAEHGDSPMAPAEKILDGRNRLLTMIGCNCRAVLKIHALQSDNRNLGQLADGLDAGVIPSHRQDPVDQALLQTLKVVLGEQLNGDLALGEHLDQVGEKGRYKSTKA